MLIPQFSIRLLLVVMTACAGVFSIVALGVQGHMWAVGISVALGALALVMLVYALMFGLVWTLSGLATRLRPDAKDDGRSPFRERGDRSRRSGFGG